MTSARSVPGARQTRKWVRTILIANLVLLAALIGPGSSHKLYLAERRLGVAYVIDLLTPILVRCVHRFGDGAFRSNACFEIGHF
jgi:hypothetical protein